MRATWSNHAQDILRAPSPLNPGKSSLNYARTSTTESLCCNMSSLLIDVMLRNRFAWFSNLLLRFVCLHFWESPIEKSCNEWMNMQGKLRPFFTTRSTRLERGSICEGQMRLSVNQTHKNVWKRVVTKISVMLHFQSGNFHRVMTTHIKTRSLRMSENMEHVYFPTTCEEESQLATEGISNESRVRMTQPTKRRFPVDFSLFAGAVFLRIFASSDTAENAHKHIRRFLVERCS